MFFKRSQQEAADRPETTAMSSAATPPRPLAASELRRLVDPATLGFKSTAELEPILGLIGQERALKAIQFGASIKSHDFNVFVLGPAASGKTTAVRQYLERTAKTKETPPDWVYVNNFETPKQPARAQAAARTGAIARQGHDRGHRRAQEHAAGDVRGRGLSGPPPRHRRGIPLRARRRRWRR